MVQNASATYAVMLSRLHRRCPGGDGAMSAAGGKMPGHYNAAAHSYGSLGNRAGIFEAMFRH